MKSIVYKNGKELKCSCGHDEFYISYDFKTAICRKCGKVENDDEYRQDVLDSRGWKGSSQ